jgi:hypothetical protein
MNRRLIWAFCAYTALAIGAGFTLDGKLRLAVWIVLGYFAIRTYIAHRAGW